jgi:hypothetical protein
VAARALLVWLLIAGAGCGARFAELSWKLCRVTRTARGGDVDDGPVVVEAIVRRDAVESLVAGHYGGDCGPAPAPLSAVRCHDPIADEHYVLEWTRPSPTMLALDEHVEYRFDVGEAPPPQRPPRALWRIAVAASARVTIGPLTRCQLSR